jgi:16S rRNA (uracil1498-N3)-methyltransferase
MGEKFDHFGGAEPTLLRPTKQFEDRGMTQRRPPRLYVVTKLAPGEEIELETGQSHYLRSVLRLGPGAPVAAFNTADGEWLCRIAELGKGGAQLTVEHQLRQAEPARDTDLWLIFAPIKRAALAWLVEKATELGVAALVPVWTVRTQVERVNLERLRAHAVEAAEQSERLSVPELRPPEQLQRVLAAWPAGRRLMVCDERGKGEPLSRAAMRMPPGPMALLVGPEGGFDETELDAVGNLSFVTRVGLGPRVLRAETAALAALAVFQAIAGDWRHIRVR